jgi:hypothetical protein
LDKLKIKIMKNLNSTIQKVAMPKPSPVTLVSRKLIYSLCAVLLLLTCSLSTKAQCGSGTGQTDTRCLPDTLGFTGTYKTYFEESACTSCSPLTNTYGDAIHSGSDKYIKLVVADYGYVTIYGGTSDFDSVFELFDSSWSSMTSADDGHGSSGSVVWWLPLQPQIQFYASPGTYYLIVDGTDKYGEAKSGTVNISYSIQ